MWRRATLHVRPNLRRAATCSGLGRGDYAVRGGVAPIDTRARVGEPPAGKDQVRRIDVSDLNAWFGLKQVLFDINMVAEPKAVTAIIGPSGCGKSTFIRCLNRLHEEVRGARVQGKVLFNGMDVYAADVDPVEVRRRIGMVFQRANPFPTMSVLDNAMAGLKLAGGLSKSELRERAERALQAAGLWDEVKDRLGEAGSRLSGGQQQR